MDFENGRIALQFHHSAGINFQNSSGIQAQPVPVLYGQTTASMKNQTSSGCKTRQRSIGTPATAGPTYLHQGIRPEFNPNGIAGTCHRGNFPVRIRGQKPCVRNAVYPQRPSAKNSQSGARPKAYGWNPNIRIERKVRYRKKMPTEIQRISLCQGEGPGNRSIGGAHPIRGSACPCPVNHGMRIIGVMLPPQRPADPTFKMGTAPWGLYGNHRGKGR